MGGSVSTQKVFGVFEGEAKPGESRILRRADGIIDPNEPKTMLEELR